MGKFQEARILLLLGRRVGIKGQVSRRSKLRDATGGAFLNPALADVIERSPLIDKSVLNAWPIDSWRPSPDVYLTIMGCWLRRQLKAL